MRVKFEAADATGKVHKRSSMSRVYSHCVLIHFAAHPPSKFWPKGVAACSRAEWGGTMRWPIAKPAAGVRIRVSRPSRSLRRGKCDAIPEGQKPRAGKPVQLRDLDFRDGDESTACYAVELKDAVNAAIAMARKCEL
jgi:hypothetical protein